MKKWMVALFFMAGFAHANDTVTNTTSKLIVACDSSTVISAGSGSSVQLVAGAPGKRIYVCGYNLSGDGSNTLQFWYGTGVTCFTGLNALTGVMSITTNTVVNYGGGLGTVFGPSLPGQALCINNASGSTSLKGVVTFTQL